MDTNKLISGYTAYTTAEVFGASHRADAPATTPSIVTASSPECSVVVSGAVSGFLTSAGATKTWGC
ncbi:LxmA leader domain family RiPP [Streptomyces sp. ISL-11]|uniref:LxmA leader domain family RiPP n=1 Tax=Streptomyces sp. ISL-11 TaxID=2819174 RepID=UPI0027E57E77|nr:LxmA leader domain family RiPP [Streptomyces sp. ISL-11]